MTSSLFFESHGTSLDNEKGIASGHLDPPLSKKGREQAAEMGNRYKNRDISIVCCSDLQRSFETAEIAFGSRGISIIKDLRLREWDFGKFNGHPAAEVDEMKLVHISVPFPCGESLLDAVKRTSNFLHTLPTKPILLVGHRVTYYALEHLYNKIFFVDLLKAHWHWQPGWIYKRTKNDSKKVELDEHK